MGTTDNLGILVREAFNAKKGERVFRPCAFFDERLDCIRVIARDCSVTETRVNELITILEANYPQEEWECVGFTVKGAKHFCETYGLSPAAPIKVSDLLDAVLRAVPNAVVHQIIQNIARPLTENAHIEQVEPIDVRDGTIQEA